jgi:hypothetical protein
VSLSVRNLSRPLLLAALLLAARAWLDTGPQRLTRALVAASRVLLGSVLSAAVLGWVTFLSTTCGGADSYGYVSAADRLLSGSLVQVEPLAHILPFPDAITAATPLGYTPSPRVADASVPIYPLGLPALMAAATMVAEASGPFAVAPLSGLLLLVGVYLVAFYASRDRLLALTAAALTSMHPVVFTYSIQPMSDVPAAAFFLLAVAGLLRQPDKPLLAGIAAAMCLLVRPALTPALVALLVIPIITERRIAYRRALWYAMPVGCGVAIQGGLQWYLYGHPLANGYADMGTLFSIDRVGTNARSHLYWAWRSLGPVFLGSAVVGLVMLPAAARATVIVVTAAVTAPYLAYRTFDHWETLRFLLPALVLLTVPAAAGLLSVARLVAGPAGGALISAAVVLFLAYSWTGWLRTSNVFTMPDHETRYRLAGELVRQTTPSNAVVLAQLHSGSIRYYSRRSSVNWERIPAGALPATLAAMHRSGSAVYLLIDGEEEHLEFEQRHGSVATWLPVGQRRTVQLLEAPATGVSAERYRPSKRWPESVGVVGAAVIIDFN